MEEPDMPQMTI